MAAPDRSTRWTVSSAWRSLPAGTRREIVGAAVTGRRPRTDPATWRTALDWAELYPALAGWRVLGAACVLWLTFRGIYSPLTWVAAAVGALLLVSAAWSTFAAHRVRHSPGPEPLAEPSEHPAGTTSS